MKRKYYKIIIVCLAVVLFFIFSQEQKNDLTPKSANATTREITTNNILIDIIAEDITSRIALSSGQSLYDALVLAKENKQIVFSGKNYPALGFFVTNIGSLHSGNGKNLIYYINGQEASVGVSSYFPQNGDVVEWKLK